MGDHTGLLGTLLGPITTAWSMPPSCTVHVLNCATCTRGYRGQRCVDNSGGGKPEDYSGCWPPATPRAGTPQHPFAGWGFYSPGLACPTGYMAACTAEHGGRAEWDIEFTLLPGETAIGCCPQGFHCTNLFGNTCLSTASTGAPSISAVTGFCSGTELVNVGQLTLPTAIITASSGTGAPAPVQTETRPVTLYAPMFQLNYQSSDMAALSPSTSMGATATGSTSAPNDSSNAATDSSSSSPAASNAPVAASESNQPGLSTAALVGIAVGAAVGTILLAAVVSWVWIKRRRQRAAQTVGPDGIGGAGETKFDTGYYGNHAVHGWAPSELAAHRWAPSELEPSHGSSELPAGTPRNKSYYEPRSPAELG
ncbi:hypothetical protein N658DRAFT_520411 [Parathielavia hyrcaniae]|uniref:Uncharacterized protein n=1 Tax=Parathielavia hyrcaniae TaxID=113614 RepID=A0AAN6QB66_9PEZI|nr:hypothetical protein N658DRAFT_520411 [Parathielavia hyrcaniae]